MKFLLLVGLAVSAMAHSNFTNSSHHHDHDHDHDHHCGTRTDQHELELAQDIAHRLVLWVCKHKALQHVRICRPYSERIKRPVIVPVWYHIIHSGSSGRLTDSEVQAQFDQVNKDFLGQDDPSSPGYPMDITFSFAGATFTDNNAWFRDLERYETNAKQLLAVDNTYNFNQYFGDLSAGLLGFCYYPNSFAESSFRHGCVNLYSSIPGGSSGNYNEGKTTTHETGHGIGIPHTFQNGCNGRGDYSTPNCAQQRSTSGCPNSIPSSCGCPDPIHNYMDYSYDRCMTQFTSGQDQLANEQLFTYRPSLYNSQQELDDILAVLPTAWDEAKEYGKKLEVEHIARRHAMGYDLDIDV